MNSCPLIVVTGPDGAGKTSVCHKLCQSFTTGFALNVTVWDSFKNNPFFSDSKQLFSYLGQLDEKSRLLFILHGISVSLRLAANKKPDFIVFDGYWYKYAISEATIASDFSLLEMAKAFLPQPDIVFLLNISPSAALIRKPSISSYECGNGVATKERFLNFQTKTRVNWQFLKSAYNNWFECSSDFYGIDYLADWILEEIKKFEETNKYKLKIM